MRVFIVKAAVLAVALILGLGIYLVGCEDKKGVNPVEPKEYYAYFGDEKNRNALFRYSTKTMEVDTFFLPYDSYQDGYGISPDGKIMYLHTDEAIVEVSTDSFEVIAEHPIVLAKGFVGDDAGHKVLISPDGRYLAVFNRYLHIVDLADFSVVYSDTSTWFYNGWFSRDGESFFCAASDDEGDWALEVRLTDSLEARRHVFDAGSFNHIRISSDNRLWFLAFNIGNGYSLFQVYDVENDTVIFEKPMCPWIGDMELTPDGRYLIYSQPGSMLGWCPPVARITIFDIAANKIDREVVTFDASEGVALAIGELWVTPDGRHLVGISGPVNNEGHGFQYNLSSHEVENRFRMYPTMFRMLLTLAGQSKL